MNKNVTAQKNEQNAENKNVVSLVATAKKEEQKQHTPTMEELQAKALKIYHLTKKYEEIKEKKAQVDRFQIVHEKDNAHLTIVDLSGEEITTSNPKSIKQVLEIWRVDLQTALNQKEEEIRALMQHDSAGTSMHAVA